jgi:O-antigen/teichoic acid export membrane protein
LAYFGTISSIIIYAIINDRFLTNTDLIYITLFGSIISVCTGSILLRKYLRFHLPTRDDEIKYRDVVSYSTKFSIGGIGMTIPRTLDVYFIQFFFGTNYVGLYGPAKTLFRFVEDLINTIYSIIYSHIVKFFASNDIISVNKIITKTISILVVLFMGICIIL